ncbi:hypothetical protein ACFWGN_14940 [Oerskovia sp. NPDC060338]|uniref:hypothetical protein n=1 Tax=Oerskovia sp. NPDC060338 TaxID=3347100 RepID=UPI00364F50B6
MTRTMRTVATTTVCVLTLFATAACSSDTSDGGGEDKGAEQETTESVDRALFDTTVEETQAEFERWDAADQALSAKATEVQAFCDENWRDTGEVAATFTDAQACFDYRISEYFPASSPIYGYADHTAARETIAEKQEAFDGLIDVSSFPNTTDGFFDQAGEIATLRNEVATQVELALPAAELAGQPS